MTAYQMFCKDFREQQQQSTIVHNSIGEAEVVVVSPTLLLKLSKEIESKGERVFMSSDCTAIKT
jgi:hypothetical protein